MTARDQFSFESAHVEGGVCNVRLLVERRLQGSGYSALGRICCEFHRESGVVCT